MPLSKYRYVVVEGPIGAGKTSLAKKLAERFNWAQLLEQPEDNPFLAQFYKDPKRFALPTQLSFLFQRINQLRELSQLDMFSNATVSDFLIEKDPIFARLTLNDDELQLYRTIFETLKPQAPAPDLVIYLQAQPETLIERVKRRSIAYEKPISEEYLLQLADSYSRFFYNYNGAPMMIINSENLNFVDIPEHFDLLLDRIGNMRSRREFFNRGE